MNRLMCSMVCQVLFTKLREITKQKNMLLNRYFRVEMVINKKFPVIIVSLS
ncbi:hypothetical protein AB1K18_16430 [Peribacillus simplex]|uniref:hypothetical protein n=1 Tax=Peribacillus simplex TaxID=1478 RepID=UPI003B8E1DBA